MKTRAPCVACDKLLPCSSIVTTKKTRGDIYCRDCWAKKNEIRRQELLRMKKKNYKICIQHGSFNVSFD